MAISIFRNGEAIQLTNKEIADIASYYHDEDVYEQVKEELIDALSAYLEEFLSDKEPTLTDLYDIIYDVVADRVNNNDDFTDDYIKQSDDDKFFKSICKDDRYDILAEIEDALKEKESE